MTTSNPYAYDSIAKQGSALGVANAVTSLAKPAPNVLKNDGSIAQPERLFSARARYGATNFNGANLVESRGQWAYIKLDTSEKQRQEYLSGKTQRDVTYSDLIGKSGPASMMSDSTGKQKNGYDKFLLTSVSCSMTEKVQISEVFGDNEIVYYFGRQPLIFNISGILIDSPDNDWFVTWMKMYGDFLRGTQTARNYELVKLVLPNMIITGTISGFSYNQDSARDVDIPFGFQFIAKIVQPLPAVSSGMLTSSSLTSIDFSQSAKFVSQKYINSVKGRVAFLTNVVKDPTSSLKAKADAMMLLGSGLGGASESASILGKVNSTIQGWNNSVSSTADKIQNSAMFQTVTSSLEGIRTNLFSPIFGILSSLTKLVANTANSATRLFLNLTNPVRNVLRDIISISRKAVALVNLVNNSIEGFGRTVTSQLRGTITDFKIALREVKNAAGAIATAPLTASHALANMFSHGSITSSAVFLQNSKKLSFSKPYLTSNNKYIPPDKSHLIKGISPYSASTANFL